MHALTAAVIVTALAVVRNVLLTERRKDKDAIISGTLARNCSIMRRIPTEPFHLSVELTTSFYWRLICDILYHAEARKNSRMKVYLTDILIWLVGISTTIIIQSIYKHSFGDVFMSACGAFIGALLIAVGCRNIWGDNKYDV